MRHLQFMFRFITVIWALGFGAQALAETFTSRDHDFEAVVLARGLDRPWGMAFLPQGGFLVTERSGGLQRVDEAGKTQPVSGAPAVAPYGQGGLLDVALAPDFARSGHVYFTYAATGQGGVGTELARGVLAENRIEDLEVLFRMQPKVDGGRHFGSRLLWMRDGTLLVTMGDRGFRKRAQDRANHIGTIVRLHPDGAVPQDNPFIGDSDALPEIYSFGHRNVQGITRDEKTDRVWAMEHGPQGGDEVNLIQRGVNYGWPTITYGVNYGIGTRIGEGTERDGMMQPIHQWTPSIAPSGLTFYDGDKFPKWRGSLFAGALKYRLLSRLVLDGDRVVSEERLLEGKFGRIRDVRTGPDGYLYLLTDSRDGKLIRLEPKSQ